MGNTIENTWEWLRKSNLKGCTEALFCSAQEQALRMKNVKFHRDKAGESPIYRMCRVENETVSPVRCCPKRDKKGIMTMYVGIYNGDYVKSMVFKEHNSGTSIIQMELLRTKGTRFCGILQSSVIPRLKPGDQILLLLIKPRRKLKP